MININLLPEVLRKKERMPLPQFLGLIGGLLAIGFMLYMITKYQFDTIPNLKARRDSLQRERTRLQAQVKQLQDLISEINRLSEHVEAVRTLYKNRYVWSKILSDIKNIVNFDATMSKVNADMRYLWLVKLDGKGTTISMNGFATASSQMEAMKMPQFLLERFRTYVPSSLPEKDEEIRLNDEIRAATSRHDALRRENPDLPVQGEEEAALRRRLAEVKNIKSGGIAMQPFSEIIKPGSIRLVDATWSSAPRPRGSAYQAIDFTIYPQQAWTFKVEMELRPPGETE